MTLLLWILAAAFAVQLVLWAALAFGLQRVREAQPEPDAGAPDLPLSVVVAARDEAARLPALLDALDAQTYCAFEVVVVDDRSTDGTRALVEQRIALRAAVDARLRLVSVGDGDAPSGLPPKKHALTQGIAAARHARVVLTDADAVPPPSWLARIAAHAAPEGADDGAVLVGPGPLAAQPGALALFARYETVQTAVLAAAAVGWGRPWQAVGRNLSYPRALFDTLGGFASGAASLSGDDDLLVQEVARRRLAPVRYVLDADAAVPSDPPAGLRAFWRQKRRHASAGAHYPAAVLLGLGAFHVSTLALWVGAPVLYALGGTPAGLGMLAVRLLFQRAVLASVREPLGVDGQLSLWQPALDAASAVYHVVFAALGALPAPRRW
jgi:cellulose synthase/poly-beta-1,6-N-acetylglucosamine synthase-like glycosyltransferase